MCEYKFSCLTRASQQVSEKRTVQTGHKRYIYCIEIVHDLVFYISGSMKMQT